MKRGIFITFEGPEGSGKSTHIQLLAKTLRREKYGVTLTREPGGTAWAKPIRNILLHTREEIAPRAELLLYEADRAQHLAESIEPALRTRRIVLCDRYTDSTLAYQGYGRGLNLKLIETLNAIASNGLKPDLTILLDVAVDRGLRQVSARKKGHDRLERAGTAFHQRVRHGFLRLASKEPRRFRVVKQQSTIAATQSLVFQIVDAFLRTRS